MSNNQKILFLNLYAYSLTGGVEKVSRNFVDALTKIFGKNFQCFSMYDKPQEVKNTETYSAFAGAKIKFIVSSVLKGFKTNTVVLSHINLLLVAKLISLLGQKKRYILFAHGIEVWSSLPTWKVNFLKKHGEIWAVSKFTKQKLIDLHGINEDRIKVLNNSLPANLTLATVFEKPLNLLHKYQINNNLPILYTLNRLSSTERYKGYDAVIKALGTLKKQGTVINYLLAGKADEKEKLRIEQLIAEADLAEEVKLIGFVPNNELTEHFLLCDAFIMPSTGEGFGVVFIEAAAQGCQIIGGNVDGSTDALLNGKLGQMVNPTSEAEIIAAIKKVLNNPQHQPQQQQALAMQQFGFEAYCEKVKSLLN